MQVRSRYKLDQLPLDAPLVLSQSVRFLNFSVYNGRADGMLLLLLVIIYLWRSTWRLRTLWLLHQLYKSYELIILVKMLKPQ
ncbi:hypothetical protein HanIR_Chr03g0101031 [Helianthus annuus]|nr:hypothetical protein HanIR_Chr03g0101031 [Helianthus annuus]